MVPTRTPTPTNTPTPTRTPTATPTRTPTPTATPVSRTVMITNFAFVPATLTIRVGETVTWINNDDIAHTATSDTGVFRSPFLEQGQSFSFRFTSVGTFPYFCEVHPDMRAQIIVTN